MPASEAQIRANKLNAAKSTGPKTAEGKEASRANALKHGLTATVVLPERESVEVQRRFIAFCEELQPSGEVGMALARVAATMSVRMERCVEHENARLTERVRRAEADFEAPHGSDDATAAKLRAEAGKLALFDPSPEASLARKYEASALRGFFRALKELRQIERDRRQDDDADAEDYYRDVLASFRQTGQAAASLPSEAASAPQDRFRETLPGDLKPSDGRVDVPFAVGKRR